MIGTIRKQMQKSGAKIILWLTLLSLAGGSFITFFRFSRRFKADSVARVNDQQISYAEFRRKAAEAHHLVQEIRRLYGPQADMVLAMWGFNKKPDEYAMDSLISEKVVQSAADNLGVEVNKEYVQAKLRDPFFVREFLGSLIPPQAMSGGALDVAVLKYYLQRQGIAEEQFDEMLTETMKRALLQRLIEGALYVPRMSVKEEYERENLKRKYATLRLPMGDYIQKAKQQKLTEAEIERYYDQHKQQYSVPEKRTARLWAFDADNFGVTINDKDIESAYHKRKKSFVEKPEEFQVQHIFVAFDKGNEQSKIEARKKAQDVYKEVKDKPEKFEATAAKFSQSKDKANTISVKRGGKVGMFEETVYSLSPNEISPPIESDEGYEIIKLISKKDATYKPLAQVKDTIVKSLKQDKFAADFNANAQRVISQASDLPEVFTKFIAERKGKESALDNVTREGSIKTERLFALAKKGDKAFFEEEGKGYIIELTGIAPSFLPALKDNKEKVVADLYKDNARKAIESDIQNVKARIKEHNESLQKASQAASAKGEFSTTDMIDPQNKASVKKLEEKKLSSNKMLALTAVNATGEDITPDAGYIFQVLEAEPINMQDFERKKDLIALSLRQEEAGQLQKSFMDALKAQAKVDINTDLMRRS